MATILVSLFFVSLPFLFFLHRYKSKLKSKAPPGPPSFPIIGNIHQLGPVVHRSLYNLSKLHGPVFKLDLGRIEAVVISSPSLSEQVLKTHDLIFCSRAPVVSFKKYSYNFNDVAAAPYGDHWRNLRRIFILELLSSQKLPFFRSVRDEETERMITSIKTLSNTNSIVNITELAARLASNIICRVAFGYRSEGKYGEKSRFQNILEAANDSVSSFYASEYFPGFGWFDEISGTNKKLRKVAKDLDDFYEEIISAHLKNEKTEETDRDIVDVLLKLWKEKQINMDQIKGALMNIFVAGTDTSSATIVWGMAELAKNPTAMKKAQAELREAIGSKGKVEETDLPRLQCIKFIVNETLRLHPPAPLLVPRETTQDCVINGYNIKSKTRVFVNAWAIGRDEGAWECPEQFIPDRFVGKSVDYNGQYFEFIPFGAGRRICPGIQFGVANVELALANLLYAFDWELPAEMREGDIDMYEAPGLVTHKKTDLRLVPSHAQ